MGRFPSSRDLPMCSSSRAHPICSSSRVPLSLFFQSVTLLPECCPCIPSIIRHFATSCVFCCIGLLSVPWLTCTLYRASHQASHPDNSQEDDTWWAFSYFALPCIRCRPHQDVSGGLHRHPCGAPERGSCGWGSLLCGWLTVLGPSPQGAL